MHVRCCAHILNLVVQDGLKDYHSSIRKIRNAVNYVRKSPGRLDMDLNDNMQKNEVDLYLMENLEKKSPGFDLLNWWKVNSTKYPILGQMARDILAIPLSTVASESAFSTGGRVLNNYRSSLTSKTVEALICTQNWCKSSPVAAEDIEELLEELENLELELAPIPQLNEDVSDNESD
ncbi:zinc finger BED domain-containing protein DAYSLEEPER [Trifolium repens]|nr:zinc finger BED domain-containing protein DAYSLEEPER [Trifolium repens]